MAGKKQTHNKLLPPRFLRENECLESSVQRFVYSMLLYDGLEQIASDMTVEHADLGNERREQIAREKEMILASDDPEKIFELLRKNLDNINNTALIGKALDYESEILPMVAEKLIRNSHDTFIENAIRLLAKSNEDYSAPLKEKFDEIRSPYVQSLVCLILGFRAGEDIIPWMMDRYIKLKKLYPEETYDQGPLLALYELNARFS